MRPLWRTVLRVVVVATTMCSGIKPAMYHESSEDEGHEGVQGHKPYPQDLDRAA